MKNPEKLAASLYFSAGILFFISSIIGKDYVFIPIGCSFVCLGAIRAREKKDKSRNGQTKDE